MLDRVSTTPEIEALMYPGIMANYLAAERMDYGATEGKSGTDLDASANGTI